jgi:tRNA1Val (adenine37-N6)-methyltransferase
LFKFKQFSVSQQNCPLKINTDGVLLAALANISQKQTIIDIGTGTGVIALMLAQKNPEANIDAVEIDAEATKTASLNFNNSPFKNNLNTFNLSFQDYFTANPNKYYDKIVSNPPFFIDALKSKQEKNNLARHTNSNFFYQLFAVAAKHLSKMGTIEIIVPTQIEKLIVNIAHTNQLYLNDKVSISSFADGKPIRSLLNFGKTNIPFHETFFNIYETEGIHSQAYKTALKDFFIAF